MKEKIDLYHPIYPGRSENIYDMAAVGNPPEIDDFNSPQEWQEAYDQWYKQRPGSCPNFAGHF